MIYELGDYSDSSVEKEINSTKFPEFPLDEVPFFSESVSFR